MALELHKTNKSMNWEEAKMYCFALGEGWRLPTPEDCKQIYSELPCIFWYWCMHSDLTACKFYPFPDWIDYEIISKGTAITVAVRDLKDN